MTSPIGLVEAHYDAFPYPTPKQIAQQLPSSFVRGQLGFLLRRRSQEWLPPDGRIWVAGCGTQQGSMWALSNPDAEVLATDVSGAVVDMAADLAQQLQLTNVRFEQRDLTEQLHEAEFDLVVCTGVVHHMPEPAVGLRNIHRALKPSGAALLMVYSRMHREPLAMFRQTLSLLAAGEEDTDRRYELACAMLEPLVTSERTRPPSREAFELLWHQREDRALLADALLHPLEICYDIDGLLELLRDTGFHHSSWLRPAQWEIERYLGESSLVERVSQLDPVDQWKIVYFMAGAAGPLLEVVAEPATTPARVPYELNEMLQMPVVFSGGSRVFRVEGGRVQGSQLVPAYELRDGEIVGHEHGAFGGRLFWRAPAELEPVLRACDGERTLGRVLEEHSSQEGRQALLQALAEFLPPGLGLLVPCPR